MDWISGIQRAIDYTEAHLTDEIDYAAAAREAASSVFHFQRMFSMLVGYTLGDYSRMRRLSLAADELHRTEDIEIILSKMLVAFKARIDAIPAKAAPVVAKMTDNADVFDKLKELTDEALRDLSDFDLVFETKEKEKRE